MGLTYIISDPFSSNNSIFFSNSFRNGSLSLILVIITILRRKISSDEITNMMKNFDSFMFNHICFSVFKEYLNNYHEDEYKLLSFWIEYNIFKKQAMNQ